jgi:glycosylphosphatidylinositol transamidase
MATLSIYDLVTNYWCSIWVFTLIAMEAVKTYRTNPNFVIGTYQIPTWITPLVLVLFVSFLIPNTSFLGHCCGLAFGYGCKLFAVDSEGIMANFDKGGLGYLKFLAPPEWILRWIEGKLNLLGRLPHYVSVDQKTYGRYGVLPTTNAPADTGIALRFTDPGQRLGP